MCGASMESVPCSNVGHIYREFNRFSKEQDPLIDGVQIGRVLDRNDARVAAVWMDEYAAIFMKQRSLETAGLDLGDLSARRQLRERLQCHNFKWFMDEIIEDQYVPDIAPTPMRVQAPGSALCLDAGSEVHGPPVLRPCAAASRDAIIGGRAPQLWTLTADGYRRAAPRAARSG